VSAFRIVGVIALLATAPVSVQAVDMPDWIKLPTYDCTNCHAIDYRVFGPAWKDVAEKYKSDPAAKAKLIAKVKMGGNGVWGTLSMPAHPNLTHIQLNKVVSFILSLAK